MAQQERPASGNMASPKQRADGPASGSCFKEVELLLNLALPPSGLRDVNAAVCAHLNQSLMKYVALEGGVGGVLVAYWGVALEGASGRILYEQPELHCRVRLHALFFAPSPGLALVGEVNKVGSDHVGLLVAGAFNASVGRDAVPADLVPVTAASPPSGESEEVGEDAGEEGQESGGGAPATDRWRSTSDPTRELYAGCLAALQTTAVNTSRGIITIFGSMLAPHTGPLRATAAAAKGAKEESQHQQDEEKEGGGAREKVEEVHGHAQEAGENSQATRKQKQREKKGRGKRKDKEPEAEAASAHKDKGKATPKTKKRRLEQN